MQLRHAAATDNGRARDHNEDAFLIEDKPARADAGALFVICDGMGGFASGEVASELASKAIIAHFYTAPVEQPGSGLRAAFLEANRQVFSEGRGKMGTTGVAALFLGESAMIANVGDSRAYLLRNGDIRQLTRDHSFVAEQVSAGMLTDDQARASSYRNIITRALGHRQDVDVDLFLEQVGPGDRLLLCSDGLHSLVESAEIAEIAGDGPLQDDVDDLIMLANERGGTDNITVVLIEVVAVEHGRVMSLPAASAPTRSGTVRDLSATPTKVKTGTARTRTEPLARPRTATTPPMPAPARRGPIVGLLLMTLLALALLGGMAYLFLNNGLPATIVSPTATIPVLTPPGPATPPPVTSVPVTPTLVSTAVSTPTIP